MPQVQVPFKPGKRNGPIAFLLPKGDNNSSRITQPFYAQLFYRAEKECHKQGYTLIYSTLDESDDFDGLVQSHGFSGIFFVSNVAHRHLDRAIGLGIQAIRQAGLKVPDDISIIGYDNSDQAKYSVPKITTVEIHASLMAQTAARMLFQQIDDYEVLPVKILTPVELVEQDSVCQRDS